MLAGEDTLYNLADVDEQVEAVSHLNGGGRSLSAAVGIAATSVSADDLHTRMVAKPGSEGFGCEPAWTCICSEGRLWNGRWR